MCQNDWVNCSAFLRKCFLTGREPKTFFRCSLNVISSQPFSQTERPFYSPLERDREWHSTIKFFMKNNHFKNRSRKKCQLCEKLISGRDTRLSISIHVSFFRLQQFFSKLIFIPINLFIAIIDREYSVTNKFEKNARNELN